MAAPITKTFGDDKNVESKQLLYSDIFGQCYQEDRLRVVGIPKPQRQEQLHTYSVPQSSVLSSIKSFLPRLSDANMKMAQEIENHPEKADQVNIEHLESDKEEKHIEMNISLIPSVNDESLNESDDDDDDNSCSEDDIEDCEEPLSDNGDEDKNDSVDGTFQKSDATEEMGNLTRLKLPSSHKKGSKHKPHIEEIKGHPSTLEAINR